MPILLCSLGTSWAVVPEAFHLLPPGPNGFSAVHVLTSDSPKTDEAAQKVRDYFGTRHPDITLTIVHVADFSDLRTSDDHAVFEETLLRWILAKAPDPTDRYLCLAGGFKTMSAAMQRAAGFLGAAKVFHVLADPSINTAELVETAAASGQINFVCLGAEPGWPASRELQAIDFPLSSEPRDRIRAVGFDLSNRIAHHNDAQRYLAGNFKRINTLPFPTLALRSPSRLAWLNAPFQSAAAGHHAWLENLPKIELHCHLGGFATHGQALNAIRATATYPEHLPPIDARPFPADWPTPPTPCGLSHYLQLGDNNGSRLLQDPGCLRAQCEHLYQALVADNVIYAEIRCSPNNYASADRSAWDVVSDIRDHFQRCMEESAQARADCQPACRVNLIIIATRKNSGDFRTAIARHLMLAVTAAEHWRDESSCRVVGVDLAGFEDTTTRAHYFRDDFRHVHRCGLALTVHAGENDDAEGIWSAVFDLNAMRLGHALSLYQAPDLLRAVAARHITIEMCPAANLQIKGFPLDQAAKDAPLAQQYPLLTYLRAGVQVTVNTDNIGISAATLTDNLTLAARLCPGLTPLDILQLQRNALDAAFIPPVLRTTLTARLTQALER